MEKNAKKAEIIDSSHKMRQKKLLKEIVEKHEHQLGNID